MRKVTLATLLLFLVLPLGVCFAGSATWNQHPISGDWNTAVNWTPATVPNGPADTASFASSSTTNLSLSAGVEVNGIVFEAGTKSFTIKINPDLALTISGAGVANSSGVLQNFYSIQNKTSAGAIYFTNSATAGDSVVYTNQTLVNAGASPLIQFEDSATAGSAEFINNAASFTSQAGLIEFQGNSTAANGTFRNTGFGDEQAPTMNFRDQASAGQAVFTNEVGAEGLIIFYDTSTADHATITNSESAVTFYDHSSAGDAAITNETSTSPNWAGVTTFQQNSTAGSGTFTANGSLVDNYGNGQVDLYGNSRAGTGIFIANGAEVGGDLAFGGNIVLATNSSADQGTFYANGGKVAGADGGTITLENFATAGAGTLYANGATVDGAFGGQVRFYFQTPTAGAATLIATAGVGTGDGVGGGILFEDESTGGQAQVEVFGNGFLDLRGLALPALTIGSLEGDGLVFLGGANLSVGSNNLSTVFSGVIEENSEGTTGALTKIGTGTLTLSGASSYTGSTTVSAGTLLASNTSGSATGTGSVSVAGGTLGGGGTIDGAVTVGTGGNSDAILQPSFGTTKKVTLTIQSLLTFKSGATYSYRLKSKSAEVIANGVTIESGAQFVLTAPNRKLPAGKSATVISNTAATPISGTFANLPDGATITSGSNTFQASYKGGDGNDLTLTVLP